MFNKNHIIIIGFIIGVTILIYAVTQQLLETNENVQSTSNDRTEEKRNEEEEKQEKNVENEAEEVSIEENPLRTFFATKIKDAAELFVTRDLRIVTIGDSLTEGVGDEMNKGGYVGILEANLDHEKYSIDIQNFGKRGSRTTKLLTKLEEEEVTEAINHADIVLITIGANDIMQVFKENFTKLTLEKFNEEQILYEQRLHQIFSTIKIKNQEVDIYLVGFYNPFQQYFSYIEELDLIVNRWNNVGLQVASQYEDTYFIPIKDLFEHSTMNLFAEDNFHPNYLGYKLIANRVLQYITNEGENNDIMEQADE